MNEIKSWLIFGMVSRLKYYMSCEIEGTKNLKTRAATTDIKRQLVNDFN